jgi:dUTPase
LSALPVFCDLETRELCSAEDGLLPTVVEPGGTLPSRGFEGDAGLDLYPVDGDPVCLLAGGRMVFDTALRVAIPPHHVGRIEGCSEMASKGVIPLGCVDMDHYPLSTAFLGSAINSRFRGRIGVILANLSHEQWVAAPGTVLAHLVVYPVAILRPDPRASLDATDRD